MEPDAIALTRGRRQVTYRQLRDRSASLASASRPWAWSAGDRVAYLGPNAIARSRRCSPRPPSGPSSSR